MNTKNDNRKFWLNTMITIATPVLEALEQRRLKELMPVESKDGSNRTPYAHLEAMARLLVGMAPWLEKPCEDEEEEKLRVRFCSLAREAIDAGTAPDSPDFMNFKDGGQPIVDTAFLAHAILRSPNELWDQLEERVKHNVISAFKSTRTSKPVFSNWLLFSAIIEAVLYKVGEKDWDPMRIDFAIKQFDQWYLGDGVYSDGPDFHFDYYNSFVIHPMLVDLMETVSQEYPDWSHRKEIIIKRSQRFAAVQERLISPEGTFPPIGRSLAYRFGAFQTLAQHALRGDLPDGVTPAQVRSGLTAVIQKTIESSGTFLEGGWLSIGFSGHQPDIGEHYISTGSLYLCSAVFLPLGLAQTDPFWSDPWEAWTAKKAWEGAEFTIDHAIDD
ncbi:DUF2264 domain-containing protein [Lederbergia sp. NSJ-179]|uniref:DUF2264 domain-containing protein n=1 Tax=Lederbergia sp. NSJ-179 TaxID=2931402 RepID=UPI001FD3D48A|nr:DUF2264 domain-containing protein [Lederbergia sp. NSJ-179]MCJ7842262.1 DUF2264 domain-containing protein [Lederbergia sp. NSJ-179]